MQFFFPSSWFGWLFLTACLGLLIAASWADLRRMVVPKWITLTTLALGLIANMARGAWLGGAGLPTWVLGGGGFGLGLLDGLLFALCGALVAFALMFGAWILGVCGGGDVKLYAAVGAWVGPVNVIPVLLIAGGCLAIAGLAGMGGRLLRGKGPAGGKPAKSRLATFSWPLAVGTLLMLLFLMGNDRLLLLSLQKAPAPSLTEPSHDR